VPPRAGAAPEPEKVPEPAPDDANIDDLRRQMKEMQDRLERMSKEPRKEGSFFSEFRLNFVMARLVPAIHVFSTLEAAAKPASPRSH